jgi:predicted small lipoprotein YifL
MNTLRNRIRWFAAVVSFTFVACGGEGDGPLYVPPSSGADAGPDVAAEVGPEASADSDATVGDGADDAPPLDAAAPDGD